jgi:hypothetical protein
MFSAFSPSGLSYASKSPAATKEKVAKESVYQLLHQ